jgi:hypothetical protein
MSLRWETVSPTFCLSHVENGYEYTLRENLDGTLVLAQLQRSTNEITRREPVANWPSAYELAERWAAEAVLAR